MPRRVNAGLGMARITQLVDEIAWARQPKAVGAIGHAEVYPNSRNIIPGRTVFTVDFRSPDKAILDEMDAELRNGAKKIAEEIGLGIEIELVGRSEEHTSELQSLMRISYAGFCLKKKNKEDEKPKD